ncbi:ubiquitin-like protein 4A [Bacillus rossius redtenbacheri]|uniref:ubiquitin-like protein 4A n=1 Tax=Bacillus rossius redtenbacheri TaxID=93214 RepID=UPI002FDCECF0
MKVYVKMLQGPECTLEVEKSDTITSLKEQLKKLLKIPVEHQRLLLVGRPLSDTKRVGDYAIRDESKLHLVVMKEPSHAVLRDRVHILLTNFYSESDSAKVTDIFMEKCTNSIANLSLDDLERLATSYLQQEKKNN